MPIRALGLRSLTTGLEDHRVLIGALLGGIESEWALDRRPGLFYAGGDPGALTGSGMTASIGPFAAVVPGASSPTQGPYVIVSTDDEPVTLADGPSAGSRTDPIGVVVRDDAYDSSGEVSAAVRVIDPVADATYLGMHTVTVPLGASAGTGGIPWASAAVDQRLYTSTHGGVIPVPDMAARNRLTNVRDGTLVHVYAVDGLYMRVPDGWTAVAGQGLYDALGAIFAQLPGPWTTLPSGTGYTSALRWRREGDRIRMEGRLVSTVTGSAANLRWPAAEGNGGLIAGLTLPAEIRPAIDQNIVIGTAGDYSGTDSNPAIRLSLYASGGVYLRRLAGSTSNQVGTELHFSSFTYPAAVV